MPDETASSYNGPATKRTIAWLVLPASTTSAVQMYIVYCNLYIYIYVFVALSLIVRSIRRRKMSAAQMRRYNEGWPSLYNATRLCFTAISLASTSAHNVSYVLIKLSYTYGSGVAMHPETLHYKGFRRQTPLYECLLRTYKAKLYLRLRCRNASGDFTL